MLLEDGWEFFPSFFQLHIRLCSLQETVCKHAETDASYIIKKQQKKQNFLKRQEFRKI